MTDSHPVPVPAGDFAESKDPFGLFNAWMEEAKLHEINDANAMILATVDGEGMPNVRTVLLKGLDTAEHGPARGFSWFTNYQSAKGIELEGNAKAALLFYWKSLRRQVRIRGPVTRASSAEGDAYFGSRQRGSQIGAWASQQSRPLQDMAELHDAVAEVEARFAEKPVSRPPHWSGYRLTPTEIEFWHDRPYRLHERVVFKRNGPEDEWKKARLFP
jgi:pyridoxamine 5'-phosphate oxidase